MSDSKTKKVNEIQVDFASIECSFALYPQYLPGYRPGGHYNKREYDRIAAYYHEKPYLAEALRRSVK